MAQKSQMPDHAELIKTEINKALNAKTQTIVDNAQHVGLMENLGKFMNPVIQDQVNGFKDIFPSYSMEFLHVSKRVVIL